MKFSRLIAALGAFFVLAAGLAACGSGVPGDSVADMSGNPISTAAFNHWMYVAAKSNAVQTPGAPVIVPNDPPEFKSCIAQARKQIPTLAKTPAAQLKKDCNQLFQSLSSKVMEFLITSYWYQAEAAKQHITLTDAQVQKEFASEKGQQFKTQAEFQAFLTQSGQTLQDILYRVRVSELVKQLRAKHPSTVTPAQIQTYYSGHTSQFGTPESLSIRIVRTNDAKTAEAAKKALESGQSWKDVAKKYSVDTATKNNGGLLTGVTKGQEEQALDTAAFSAPVEQGARPDPRHVRLLRVPGHLDQEVDAADARPGDTADQADPPGQPADQRPDGRRQPGQEGLAIEDQVPQHVRDGRLRRVQGAKDELDHDAGRREVRATGATGSAGSTGSAAQTTTSSSTTKK